MDGSGYRAKWARNVGTDNVDALADGTREYPNAIAFIPIDIAAYLTVDNYDVGLLEPLDIAVYLIADYCNARVLERFDIAAHDRVREIAARTLRNDDVVVGPRRESAFAQGV